MDVNITNQEIGTVEAGLIALPIASGPSEALLKIQESCQTDIWALAQTEKFEGKPGQSFTVRGLKGLNSNILFLVGIGTPEVREFDTLRAAGTAVARQAKASYADTFALATPSEHVEALQFVEGALLGTYSFDRYLSRNDEDFEGFTSLTVVTSHDLGADVAEAQVIAEGVTVARDLVNETPNSLTPIALAQAAMDIASVHGLDAKILDEDSLTKDGFNLIMGVGKGSINAPRLIHLTYKPSGPVTKKVAFVGKGITFDTGGYNLKPGAGLLAMHSDMAGAAAVLGAAHAIGQLQPEGIEVHFVCPAAENSISGNAMRPQDIIKGYGGQTVEIHNTDAEGRLVLADALAYIQEYKVDTIIDLATLTGACVIALGEGTAAMFSDNETLAADILAAAKDTGEDMWRLPLNAKLDTHLDTPMADMKNVGPRWGGAITAALFLKRWVNIDSWAHLDIAGPAYTEKETPTSPPGGTGFGVATLVQYIVGLSES